MRTWKLTAITILAACASTCASAQDVQKGREAAAKAIHPSGTLTAGPFALAKITIRLAPNPIAPEQKPTNRGWWSFSSPPAEVPKSTTDNFEVIAEDQIIDRFSMPFGVPPATVTDDSGQIVGYFRNWVTSEVPFTSGRGVLTLYVVRPLGIVLRTVEFRCQKLESQGKPAVGMRNARWQPRLQQIAFDLSSTCYDVDIIGPHGSRVFNLLSGSYGYSQITPSSWTAQQKPLALHFSPDGEIRAVEPFKPDDPKQREITRCRETGKTTVEFVVCGPDDDGIDYAFWRVNGRQLETSMKCDVSQGKSHLVESCSSMDEAAQTDKRRRTISFQVASAIAPRPISTYLQCECERLSASGTTFDPERRLLSFNLDTDASKVRFEGGEFAIPIGVAVANGGKATLPISVFEIQLNDNWQIVSVSGSGASNAETLKQ